MPHALPDLSILRKNWPEYSDLSTTHEVKVRDAVFGGPSPVVIAGPCAIESLDQTMTIAKAVSQAGAKLMRGGIFKPRTNPHSFIGLGLEGLEILEQVRRETGLGLVTEVMDPRMVEVMAEHVDMLQVGSRSMQNFPLLTEVGKTDVPVLLKRGWSATLEEWLCAAEYIAMEGNRNIVFCERGIRTSCHWQYARNVVDLNVIEPVREATPLPIIVDPSHATGWWPLVPAIGQAALAGGAHGLIVEVVPSEADRATLKCDAKQGILPEALDQIMEYAGGMDVPDLISSS
jgi:3-deoxy-7-phosphoheptulonate synthase